MSGPRDAALWLYTLTLPLTYAVCPWSVQCEYALKDN